MARLDDAERFGRDLTPEENRRRLNQLRAGELARAGGPSSIPGQAPGAGTGRARRRKAGANW